MDDNQNEWGDEETLDTKKFRVSPLPHSLPVLLLGLSRKEQRDPQGPSLLLSAFLGAHPLLFPSV